MAADDDSVDPGILDNIRQQLDGLKRTPDGLALHSLIERGLTRYGSARGIERAFVKFLYTLLGNYIDKENSDPATRVKARVMQRRLSPYLDEEPAPSAAKPAVTDSAPPPSMHTDSAPRNTRPSSRLSMVDALTRGRASVPLDKPAAPPAESKTVPQPAPAPQPERVARPQQPVPAAPVEPVPPAVVTTGGDDYDDGSKRGQIEKLHQVFANRITDTLLKSQDFDGLLRANLKALELANQPGDIRDIKTLLMRGLGDLMNSYQEIESNLKATREYLSIAQQDRALLQNQAQVAMSHSNADQVTSLPKRAMLERQLEAEIGRAKRFGFSVALALIDLDNFGDLNARFGREAGDEVLRSYANDVLQFRAYDLVARIGNDEFAVMFPNTQKDGALSALEKAQKRAAGHVINFRGKSIVLPTFTSVLTLYAQGERPRNLIQRATETLSEVKRRGGDQLVVSLPAS